MENINNKFEQKLIDNGYKIYQDHWHGAIRLFQKKITDDNGIKYFIDCYHYNIGLKFPKEPKHDSYLFKVQYDIDKENLVEIKYSSAEFLEDDNIYDREITTLEEVETFFDNMFKNINAKYKERYGE